MLKKLLTTAAGLLLSTQAVLAQVAGPYGSAPTQTQGTVLPAPTEKHGMVFRGQTKGQAIEIELFAQGRHVGGLITLGEQMFELKGEYDDGKIINGSFEVNQNRYSFQAMIYGNQLIFQSDGNQIRLTCDNSAVGPNVPQPTYIPQQPAPRPLPAPVEPARPAIQIQQVVSKGWQYPLIAGWRPSESENGVTVSSPDGELGYGTVIRPGTTEASPVEIVRSFLGRLKAANVNVLSEKNWTSPHGDPILEVELTYTTADNHDRHMWLRVCLAHADGQNVGMIMYAATPAELWATLGVNLPELAKKTMILPPSNTPAPVQRNGNQIAGLGY